MHPPPNTIVRLTIYRLIAIITFVIVIIAAVDMLVVQPQRRSRKREQDRCYAAAKKWEDTAKQLQITTRAYGELIKTMPANREFYEAQIARSAYLTGQAVEIARRYKLEGDEWKHGPPPRRFSDEEREALWRLP